MMKGVIPELAPLIIYADEIYNKDLPFGIDEVSDDEFNALAKMVAEEIAAKHL